ncbi:hypothetical protein EZV62_006251 [Acer yangbiense]|uniref:phosphoglycerate kinase n=1 Tax=Acer yangbiense TaxID=1000413 RepID=A0A5C7IS74_9ROSI|nr:hypothetical protein EZV62_006251 [Acer yangbiense]
MGKKCVLDLKEHEFKRKRVLVRFHLDELLDENLIIVVNPIKVLIVVVNTKYLIAHDVKVILCGHLGRPEGFNSKYSLKPIAGKLSEILGVEEEEKNDPEFAKKLASNADVFVNEAFDIADRVYASTVGVVPVDRIPDGSMVVISNVLADLSAKEVTTIIGGDDTIAAVETVGVAKRMSHISTGFDAGLDILTGKQLPAVCALDDDYTPIPSEFSPLFAAIEWFAAANCA